MKEFILDYCNKCKRIYGMNYVKLGSRLTYSDCHDGPLHLGTMHKCRDRNCEWESQDWIVIKSGIYES